MVASKNEKLIEEISDMSVLELSELVKALEDKFGVSAAAPMMAVAAPAQGAEGDSAEAEEKSTYKVTLESMGTEKIKVIRALKALMGLSLSDAKKAAEDAPSVLAESVPKEEAEKIKAELEGVGATVKLL